MSVVPTEDGYRKVIFRVNKEQRCFLIHRLVMLAFRGPCPEGMVVNHLNFIRHDNNLSNLDYRTLEDNIRYSRRAGRYIKTKSYCGDRFTPKQIRYIRTAAETDHELAVKFKTKRSFINKIRNLKSYKWID
jgi:hypothetical protein